MNELELLVIERACARVVIESAVCNDQRDWAALAALYTDDGVVVRPNGQRLEGRDAIAAAYAAGPPDRVTRHMCTNVRVDVDDADNARVVSTVLMVSGRRTDDPDVTFGIVPHDRHTIGEFADHLVRSPAGWKIAERRASLHMNL